MNLKIKNDYLDGVSVIVNTLNDEKNISEMLNSISQSTPNQIIVAGIKKLKFLTV